MKRALLAALLILIAVPAVAFRPTLRRGDRVAVLLPQLQGHYGEESVARAVSRHLARELRAQGLDAFDAKMTFDELRQDNRGDADYYLEVVASDADASPTGGIGVGNRNVGVDVALVVSRVAATLRLYDGETLELIDTLDLQKNATAVVPVSIGIGRDRLGLWLALPFVQHARYRAAARAVARQAAADMAPLVE
jgi:hypothetical protein